jgi:hypothetical protein
MIAVGWLCVLRLERRRTAVPLPAWHVVNHHVFHGLPEGVRPPAGYAPGEVEPVAPPLQRAAIAGRRVRPASSRVAEAVAALRRKS